MNHACKHVSRLASDSIERKLSLWERFRFHLHLAMCRNCRNFDQALELMHQATELMRKTRYGKIELTDTQRDRLHKAMDEQI
ncbi:zf-HC2 domain-containing protein [Mariprofundus sp. NF]|uniref:zf-HC2 domain-containing protein n=1 Tax=Mariprofundus sp. NF TaxID=2608716 RepID=UPI00159FCF19|nr:zf-HC2 domain-containing protein [Mariprofundus sp. NF]